MTAYPRVRGPAAACQHDRDKPAPRRQDVMLPFGTPALETAASYFLKLTERFNHFSCCRRPVSSLASDVLRAISVQQKSKGAYLELRYWCQINTARGVA